MKQHKRSVAVLGCGFFVASILAGCAPAGGENGAAATVTVTQTVTSSPSASEEADTATEVEDDTNDSEDAGSVGKAVVNSGVSLTVQKAKIFKTIPMNRSGYRAGSGYDKITNEKPDDGGKFLVVQTKVENVGKVSMDLTCGWPIEIQVADEEDRLFDPIDDLSDYKGNPECNAQLQPGFKDSMTYAFLLPADAKAIGIVFRDTQAEDNEDYGAVRFDAPTK